MAPPLESRRHRRLRADCSYLVLLPNPRNTSTVRPSLSRILALHPTVFPKRVHWRIFRYLLNTQVSIQLPIFEDSSYSFYQTVVLNFSVRHCTGIFFATRPTILTCDLPDLVFDCIDPFIQTAIECAEADLQATSSTNQTQIIASLPILFFPNSDSYDSY